jgi:hypothetical protein
VGAGGYDERFQALYHVPLEQGNGTIMKEMKSSLEDWSPEVKPFIRIRAEEQETKWKIKADVKPRESEGRFS